MAHSFFTHLLVIVTASLFAAAVLWGEHYHPWGKRLDRRGWKFPKPRWRVQGSRTVLVEIRGRIEPPPLGDLTKNDRELLKRLERMKSDDHDEHEDQDTAG